LEVARVQLERVLVAVDVDLDPAPLAAQARDGVGLVPRPAVRQRRVVVTAKLRALHEVAVVVARAVGTAVALHGRVVERLANVLGRRPEVVRGAGHVRDDVARRDEDAVDVEARAAEGQEEVVAEHGRRRRVLEAVEVQVDVRGEHDGRGLGRRAVHVQVPAVGREVVLDVRGDLAGEALAAVRVDNPKDDGVDRVLDNFELALDVVSTISSLRGRT